jgi:hypothetical protein
MEEINIPNSSSEKTSDQNLVLMEWANIHNPKAGNRFRERHPELFVEFPAPLDAEIANAARAAFALFGGLPDECEDPLNDATLFLARTLLRKAWDAPDMRCREWFIYKARERYDFWRHSARSALSQVSGQGEIPRPDTYEPPQLTEFERLMYHFQRIADRARHCANPECPAPYFFIVKQGQIYCCEKCAGVGQREAKRKWWNENRVAWRKKNAAKKGQSR